MGANATTSVPSYVAGEVLTAADLNVTNSGIPVFADSTARTNGFGGTGEKTLAEGQYAYLESDDKTYVYDGSAWKEVGGSGLVLVKSQTIGSAVSSVTVSDAFSADYDNYLILGSGGSSSVNGINLNLTLGSTTSGYYWAANYVAYTGSSGVFNGNNDTAFKECAYGTSGVLSINLLVRMPYLAEETVVTWQNAGAVTASANLATNGGGYLNNTTSYTAFTFTTSSGTLTGGTIRVYGYRN